MKPFVIIGIVFVVIIGVAVFGKSVTTVDTYVATSTPQVVIEIEEIDRVAERIEQAQEADMSRIKEEADKAYQSAYNHEMSLIEDAVLAEVEKEISARRTVIQKENGTFWRSKRNLVRLVTDTFPEDPWTAQRIVQGESFWKPQICGKRNKNGTIDCGLWQINDIHLKTMATMGLDRLDPEDATKFARYLYDKNGGWGDWMYYVNHIALR